MQIHITARHCELDPEVRMFAQQRLEKFGRFARDIQEAHLVVTGEGGYRYGAEITLKMKGREAASHEESTEPKLAIDLAAARLEKQLRRLKERRIDRKRSRPALNGKANGKVAGEPEPAMQYDEEGIGED